MFLIYTRHYCKAGGWTQERAARIWNGGPRGNEKAATAAYWAKVKKQLVRHSPGDVGMGE